MVGIRCRFWSRPTANVDAWIAPHRSPAPALCLGVASEDPLVSLGDAVRVPSTHMDRFTTGSVAEVSPMRLAAVSPRQRFVAPNELFVHDKAGRCQEEPFTLTDVRGILAAIACLATQTLASLGRFTASCSPSERRRWESNPLRPGCSRLPGHLAPASSILGRSRTCPSTFAGSYAIHHTPRMKRCPGGLEPTTSTFTASCASRLHHGHSAPTRI